jgi:hypothetical protein
MKYKMADNKNPQQPAGNVNPNQHNVVNVNQLKTLFSNPKADILMFSVGHTKGSVTVTFMFDHFKKAQVT